ncbi:D-alanyl-D-alanine carboxypeptidase/D-alanyl-D-alanine endopeptidase [Catenuloplanes japonicus]|uniref:D-alanyl-D-alanine carboxypeptidase/D-alanyl-D-alanine endopeptidase n=1 Tax=Catenuloplanes japonicus TaxID=33876 RepID=UPI000A121BBF
MTGAPRAAGTASVPVVVPASPARPTAAGTAPVGGSAPVGGAESGARGSVAAPPVVPPTGRVTVEAVGTAGAGEASGVPSREFDLGSLWRSKKVLAGAGAAVLALVLVAVIVLAGRPDAVEEPVAEPTVAEQPAEPAPQPVLVANTNGAPMPSPQAVQAAIGALVTNGELGPGVHAAVVDVATGTELYGYQQSDPATPASTTKLVTAAAALTARGTGYRIPTRVVAGSAPGEVVLIGGGDPTLAIDGTATYRGAARLDELAEQVRTALGGAPVSRVLVDSTLYTGPAVSPSWDSDVVSAGYGAPITALMTNGARVNPKAASGAQRQTDPDLSAGKAFAALLGDGVTVGRGTATSSAAQATPQVSASAGTTGIAPGIELGRVESPTMLRLVEVMLTNSDNVVAEALARQVAIAGGQPASFEGGAAATRALITGFGLPVDGFGLTDGSGLSRDNLISPALLTALVRLAADGSHPELGAMFSGLPVGGWSGTLDDRFRDPAPPESRAGAGTVRAKTGSLDGVNALAGVVTTADGRLLAFALLADEVPFKTLSKWQAEWKLDRIASVLASCGCQG